MDNAKQVGEERGKYAFAVGEYASKHYGWNRDYAQAQVVKHFEWVEDLHRNCTPVEQAGTLLCYRVWDILWEAR